MAERRKRPVPQSFEEYDDDLVGPRRAGREARLRAEVEDDEELVGPRRIAAPRLRRRGRSGGGERESLKALVRDIPNFLKLLGRLARDPRVSAADKAIVAAAVAYLFVPADMIPDWIPAIGEIEDVFLLALALSRLLNNAGVDVLMDHWDGDVASLETALSALDRAGALLPEPVRGLLGGRSR
ncbi:MAG TPA: YkvA family protein [Longimicrobiaceae bacterium]|nr:YkvA family protein [Longimicrobiaceae bacterium]